MTTGLVKLIESAGRLYQATRAPEATPETTYRDGQFVIRAHLRQGWADADQETDSGLTIAEIAELVAHHQQARIDQQALEQAQASADASWERLDSGATLMQPRLDSDGKVIRHDARLRSAAFELGLIGENAGEGGSRVDHEMIADHYYTLRTGGIWPTPEGGQYLEPHGHDDAVTIIETAHGVAWDSLRRAWRGKGIKVSTKAEVFPIK